MSQFAHLLEGDFKEVWAALECYREDCISGDHHDDEWGDICASMARIREACDLPDEVTQ